MGGGKALVGTGNIKRRRGCAKRLLVAFCVKEGIKTGKAFSENPASAATPRLYYG